MTEPIHIISLGAGVQSSCMALMAAKGEIGPMPTAAIFADTQAEPKSVYDWLEWLTKQLPFPVHRVSFGNLLEKSLIVRTSKNGKNGKNTKYTQHSPPAFTFDGKKAGILMRQCTVDSKITIIHREINKIRQKRPVVQWIGISLDEAHRMKPSRKKHVKNVFPLIDHGMTRKDCLRWMEVGQFPEPPRSACSFCPYHDDNEWIRLRDKEPEAFAQAVDYERRLQSTMKQVTNFRGTPWLHHSHQPLDSVVFVPTSGKRDIQINMNFGNECEGMCGV
jgi:hypothetical protein